GRHNHGWDGNRDGDWNGRPGDRDGRPGDWDGRPGDRGRRGTSLVTTIDDINRNGANLRTRELSQTDLDRIRDRSQEFRSRRDNIVADTNQTVGGAVDTLLGRDRQGRGQGVNGQFGADGGGQVNRGRTGVDGQLGTEARGQFDRARTRSQLGIDGG